MESQGRCNLCILQSVSVQIHGGAGYMEEYAGHVFIETFVCFESMQAPARFKGQSLHAR